MLMKVERKRLNGVYFDRVGLRVSTLALETDAKVVNSAKSFGVLKSENFDPAVNNLLVESLCVLRPAQIISQECQPSKGRQC